MAMASEFPKAIPEGTRAVVEGLLSGESVYRYVGEHGPELVSEAQMAKWYSGVGRPGVHPLVLIGVTIFQFMEKLPDRQAAEMAVMRLDWKYALRQELDWKGFDYSDLCNFRKRVMANGAEQVVFEGVLSYLKARGYLKAKGKQRTDSTAVLGQVAWLSRLELVWETLRLAVEGAISRDARWAVAHLPPSYIQEHSQKRTDYRLKPAEVKTALQQAGEAAAWLITSIAQGSVPWADDEALQVLRRGWWLSNMRRARRGRSRHAPTVRRAGMCWSVRMRPKRVMVTSPKPIGKATNCKSVKALTQPVALSPMWPSPRRWKPTNRRWPPFKTG